MYCEKCGKKLEDSFTFCPACGHLVDYQFKENKTTPNPGYNNIVAPSKESTYKETNILAIMAIICSIIPLAGWILGIMGLVKAKKINDSGKTLSIVALIFSTVFFALSLVILLNGNWYYYEYDQEGLNQAVYLLFSLLK